MRFVVVTGLSGAGKSTTLNYLEDAGYYCVDNMPVQLIAEFVKLLVENKEIERAALGIDVRTGSGFDELESSLDAIRGMGIDYEILFLESDDGVLVKRYKETRRIHPLAFGDRLEVGIEREREKLSNIKKHAAHIIDTSQMLTRDLKTEIDKIFVNDKKFKNLYVTILSFGFKYGIPTDADLVFDVRFLPNPYYHDELRPLTGADKPVVDFVMGYKEAGEFLDKLEDMLNFLIPNYISEGKNQLVVAIGCTGGKHRSVTLASALFDRMNEYDDYGFKLEHRDFGKDAARGK
ncbi:MAG: RNase adapter RapZ [Lachnospiraceae bacterium]|nr:RNase adapter RapZ [Lachnospiraceae bacterium]MBR2529784.1 RNase adapter RapZ [Lachnospiraceae bacterium]